MFGGTVDFYIGLTNLIICVNAGLEIGLPLNLFYLRAGEQKSVYAENI